jgi:hypothetical protein
VLVTSGATQQAAAAQQSPVSTAKVERGELLATASQDASLTYRARSDRSPYLVVLL